MERLSILGSDGFRVGLVGVSETSPIEKRDLRLRQQKKGGMNRKPRSAPAAGEGAGRLVSSFLAGPFSEKPLLG